MKNLILESKTGDPAIDIAIDTIKIGKQALVFVNTKRSAEAVAENIAKKAGNEPIPELGEKILKAIPQPTKQCRRLAYCVERGTAFHHSGLTAKQREIVEENFIAGKIKIISATPTLAAGVNIPSFRTIIRDLKRYTGQGMANIPVLEYLQMAGRSGRPDFNDEYGEAIIIAKTDSDKEVLTEKYIFGEPESIWSKVSSQPVLRTYCLSLVASEVVNTAEDLKEFFSQTFFAYQYGDAKAIHKKIDDTISQLKSWNFIKGDDDFSSAAQINKIEATQLGKRVSQLYLDPLTANLIITSLSKHRKTSFFAIMHLLSSTIEIRPLLRIRAAEYEEIEAAIEIEDLIVPEPNVYDAAYDQYLESVKTAKFLNDWCEEKPEEFLLETYGVRPGELRAKTNIADWLLYSASELARIQKQAYHVSPLQKARRRLKYGAKEELLPLLALRNIGRVRARTLYKNGIKDVGDIKQTEQTKLAQLLGVKIAKDLKKQVGQEVQEIKQGKRTGQLSLEKAEFNN